MVSIPAERTKYRFFQDFFPSFAAALFLESLNKYPSIKFSFFTMLETMETSVNGCWASSVWGFVVLSRSVNGLLLINAEELRDCGGLVCSFCLVSLTDAGIPIKLLLDCEIGGFVGAGFANEFKRGLGVVFSSFVCVELLSSFASAFIEAEISGNHFLIKTYIPSNTLSKSANTPSISVIAMKFRDDTNK